MNDPQLTDLFREQLREETQIAPGFDELWSKAASRHRSTRIRKFAIIGIAIGCVGASVFALVAKEKAPARVEQSVNAVPMPQPAELPAETKASAVPEPYQFQSESDTDRLREINAYMRFLHSAIEADQKRAAILQALNQSDEAARLTKQIATRKIELAAAKETAAKLEKVVEASPPVNTGDSILPGENVEITVVENNDLNGRYLVRRGGYIIMPGIGKVSLAGKSVAQAAKDIRFILAKLHSDQAFTVEVKRTVGITADTGPVVYLAGEFRNPRPYRIPSGSAPTLISVLLSSGGWTDRADLTRVKIMRVSKNTPKAEVFNVKKMLDGALGNPNSAVVPMLTEGDVIILPAQTESQLVYVAGAVKRSGSYRISDGEKLSVYGSILQSGGIMSGAGQLRVYILRKGPDGSDMKIPVDLEGIKEGKTPDMRIVSGDIVLVDRLAW